nr:MAG TPA: Asparagine synthase [Caudoviricetes sp.]
MKQSYSAEDCHKLRKLLINNAVHNADSLGNNILLLSGGMDSVTALYALMEAGIQFKAYTFYFRDFPSIDRKAVEILQGKIGFKHEFIEIPSDWESIKTEVSHAVRMCRVIYGRIREVKVETIFALQYLDKHLPSGGIVYSGSTGDALAGYNRNTAILASKIGEDNPRMIIERTLGPSENEFYRIYAQRHKNISIFDGEAEKFILNFTTRACNTPKPKALYYYAFADYHRKYKSYRIPKAFQKAGNEKAMFNIIANRLGCKDAVTLFRNLDREANQ